jgi:hypothetical protein
MDDAVALEARRLLDRYLIEVVEAFDLCPWAASARRRGEIRVEVVAEADAASAVARIAADAFAAIGMVVFAASPLAPAALRQLRDRLVNPAVALADFHPDAPLDLMSAARLVPFLRRSPDPMLQVVPHRVLDAVKRVPPAPARAAQAAMLAGQVASSTPVSEQVALHNLATVRTDPAAIAAVLDDIRRDRDAAYARLAGAPRAAR